MVSSSFEETESQRRVQLQAFFEGWEKAYQQQRAKWAQTAERFNIFGVRSVINGGEIAHTRFLAFLLNPMEKHDQGPKFLQGFLDMLHLMPSPSNLCWARVSPEHPLGSEGRLDLVVFLPDDRIVALENKIWAREGEDQVARYQEWLARQAVPSLGDHVLTFLTPNGRIPTTGNVSGSVITLSYLDLARWLKDFRGLPSRLGEVIDQYADVCSLIGGDVMIDAVLEFEFITEPKNLELALKLPEIMENIKRHIFQDFWEEVKTRLQDRLAQSGYDGRWCIKMSAPIDGCRSALEIKDTNDPLTDDRPGWFAMAVECLTGGPEWGYYGIHRGREVTQVADAEDGLIDALKNDGFLQESGWPGFRYIDSVPGMPVIAMTNKETLLRLNEDNRNAGHPLADRMAQLLWELFERHRERLEALNDNYPYAD